MSYCHGQRNRLSDSSGSAAWRLRKLAERHRCRQLDHAASCGIQFWKRLSSGSEWNGPTGHLRRNEVRRMQNLRQLLIVSAEFPVQVLQVADHRHSRTRSRVRSADECRHRYTCESADMTIFWQDSLRSFRDFFSAWLFLCLHPTTFAPTCLKSSEWNATLNYAFRLLQLIHAGRENGN